MRAILVCVVVASVSGSPAIGAASSRRFLLLHGSRTTAGAFLNSPTTYGAKEFLSGVPCRTDANSCARLLSNPVHLLVAFYPIACRRAACALRSVLVPPNWQYTALDAASSDGAWWSGDGFKGLDASVAAVEDAICADQAVGVIGHEQGATVAAIVAARSALGEGVPLKFAVVCGAIMPESGPHAELLERLRSTPGAAIPTLHCISRNDPENPSGGAEALASYFTGAEVLWHERGGALPSASWWEETSGYPERVTGGNRWVTQFRGPFYYS